MCSEQLFYFTDIFLKRNCALLQIHFFFGSENCDLLRLAHAMSASLWMVKPASLQDCLLKFDREIDENAGI
jgi:hypothetical protein